MFILRLCSGEGAAVDDVAIDVGEVAADRVRVYVAAPIGSRVTLVPEGVVVPLRITVWRRPGEQIHVDDVQIWVLKLEEFRAREHRVRIGFDAPQHRRIRRTSMRIDDGPAG